MSPAESPETAGNGDTKGASVIVNAIAVLREALGIDNATALRLNWRICNASVHEFQWHDKGLNLVGFNDVAHLKLVRDDAIITRL